MLKQMEILLQDAHKSFSEKDYKTAEAKYTTILNDSKNRFNEISQTEQAELNRYLYQAFNNRGQIKYLRVDFNEAVEDYDEALQIDDSSEVTFYNRGLIHYRLGRYAKAIADFNSSLAIRPDFKDSTDALKIAKLEQEKNEGDRI